MSYFGLTNTIEEEFPSPMDGTIVRMVTNDNIQNGVYISDGNFKVPKTSKEKLDSLSKSLKSIITRGLKASHPDRCSTELSCNA